MKIVLYDDDGNVLDVRGGLSGVVVDGKNIRWSDGSVREVKVHYVVVEDEVEVGGIVSPALLAADLSPSLVEVDRLTVVIEAFKTAGQFATRDLVRSDSLTEEEMTKLIDLYPDYGIGVVYIVGDIFSYSGKLFHVLQAHTSQIDWSPDTVPALYKTKAPVGVIQRPRVRELNQR